MDATAEDYRLLGRSDDGTPYLEVRSGDPGADSCCGWCGEIAASGWRNLDSGELICPAHVDLAFGIAASNIVQ